MTEAESVVGPKIARHQADLGFGATIVCSQGHKERRTGYVVAWANDKSQAWIVNTSRDRNEGSLRRAYRGLPARDEITCRSCGRHLPLGEHRLRDRIAATVATSGLAKVELAFLMGLATSNG